MFSSLWFGHNIESANPPSQRHQLIECPSMRKYLVYLAEWMCKFNVLVAVLRQLSAQALTLYKGRTSSVEKS